MPQVPCRCSNLHLPLILILLAQCRPFVSYQQLTSLGCVRLIVGAVSDHFVAAFAAAFAAVAAAFFLDAAVPSVCGESVGAER